MKKLLLLTLFLLLGLGFAFASFSFELAPNKTLYPVSLVDPLSGLTGVHLITETKSAKSNDLFLFNKTTLKYETYKYLDWEDSFLKNMHLSAGGNFSLFRCTFNDSIQVEFMGQAGLNSIFSLGGDKDMVGMDGTYFAGLGANFFDMFALKAGIKHYSGHWGDEILIKAQKKMESEGIDPRNYDYYEFVRDNQWKIGLAYTGVKNLNVALSVEAPLPNSNVRPFLDTPDYLKNVEGILYTDAFGDQYLIRGDLGKWYHALIVKFETQYTFEINKDLDVLLGANVKLSQEGVTKYTLDPKDDNLWSWDVEYNLIASFVMKNRISGHGVSLDVIFHDGRYPLLNYNFKHSQYISIGISLR